MLSLLWRSRLLVGSFLLLCLAFAGGQTPQVWGQSQPHQPWEGTIPGIDVPNDPAVLQESRFYAAQLLNLFTIWSFSYATDEVVIAVLDTGIAHDHPEFAGRILPGYDFINLDDLPEDDHGHGTHVAGIAAAAVDNGVGIAGVCGFCKILPIKVLNARENGSPAGIEAGLRYAADQGADIALLSLGESIGSSSVISGIAYAREHGVLIVAAAGNENSDVNFYPAAYPGVFAVSATTRLDRRWEWSNYGDYVAISAPGDTVFSTYPDLNNEYGGYLYMSGTSMAAPFVAGLAGLLLAQDPTRSAIDVTHLMTSTAVDLGEPGWDPQFGYGRIDPVAALVAESPAPVTTAALHGRVWYDTDRDGERDPEEATGLPGVPILLHDAQQNPIGLTNTSLEGEWEWTVAAPAALTITARLPARVMAASETLHVTVTPTAQLNELDFGVVQLPTVNDLIDFAATRSGESVRVAFKVTPLINTVSIERGPTAEGPFHFAGRWEVTNPVTDTVEGVIFDLLPVELQEATVYYRVQLLPGLVSAGPFQLLGAEPEHALFLPLVTK
jgi:hypothetical protein